MNKPWKILTFTPAFGRLKLLRIMLDGLVRLKEYKPEKFEIIPFFVVSDNESKTLIESYGFKTVFYKNDPLGEKKNAGIRFALELEWDYMIELGSDDLIQNSVMDLYEPHFHSGEGAFGLDTCFFYNVKTSEVAQWSSNIIIGLGRCISRKVIERMRLVNFIWSKPCAGPDEVHIPGKLEPMNPAHARNAQKAGMGMIVSEEKIMVWEEWRNKALDASSLRNLIKFNVPHNLIQTTEPLMLDIKNGEGITSFSIFKPCDYPSWEVISQFPEHRQMIDLTLQYATGTIK